MDLATRKAVLRSQCAELTEHYVYSDLARRSTGKNARVLRKLARDEKQHHNFWQRLSGETVRPNTRFIAWYKLLARTVGVVFALRLMERGEDLAQQAYRKLQRIKGVDRLLHDEEAHEHALIDLLKEEKLEYAGSIVLGLNDALVELTGALAGFTFALQNASLIALAGFITGFAASLSMAASGYLQGKEEADQNATKSPLKAAMYTGITYLVTVLILIAPYFLFSNIYHALVTTLSLAVVIVAGYTFYIGVAKNLRFWPRFLEMAAISLIVAALSFGVGWLLRSVFGIQI